MNWKTVITFSVGIILGLVCSTGDAPAHPASDCPVCPTPPPCPSAGLYIGLPLVESEPIIRVGAPDQTAAEQALDLIQQVEQKIEDQKAHLGDE